MIWSSIVKTVGDIGGQWLDNKKELSKAKIDFEVAKFGAKVEALRNESKQRHSLDELSVKQSEKSWFDEAISLIPIFLFGYVIGYGLWGMGNGWTDPMVIFNALEAMPLWVQILIGVIYIRYLGLRNLAVKIFTLWRTGKVVKDEVKKDES